MDSREVSRFLNEYNNLSLNKIWKSLATSHKVEAVT